MTTRMNTQPRPTKMVRDQLARSYVLMAEATGHRPYGDMNDLASEATAYARCWAADEQKSSWDIGKPDHARRPAQVFILEAARLARMGRNEQALDLLELARIEMLADCPEPKVAS
jgi:3,4-dihydroxy-2-butanone 4-phosphate synthase